MNGMITRTIKLTREQDLLLEELTAKHGDGYSRPIDLWTSDPVWQTAEDLENMGLVETDIQWYDEESDSYRYEVTASKAGHYLMELSR